MRAEPVGWEPGGRGRGRGRRGEREGEERARRERFRGRRQEQRVESGAEGEVLASAGGARRDGRRPGLKLRAVSPRLPSRLYFSLVSPLSYFFVFFLVSSELWGTSRSSVGEGEGRVGKSGLKIKEDMQEMQRSGYGGGGRERRRERVRAGEKGR